MKVVNLLEFLNKAKDLYTLNYAMCDNELVNFLDLMVEDEQFTQKIDLGIMFVNQKSLDQFVIVDGLNRILSLSLLLHAVCECYKKTTAQNDKAIKTMQDNGIDTYVEIGPGKTLTGFVRKENKEANVVNINSVETLEAFLDSLK